MRSNRVRTPERWSAPARLAGVALCATLAAVPAFAADEFKDVRGYVDKSVFTRLADEEAVTIEVWLPGSLLNLACIFDEELAEFCRGLKLIQAVVLDMSETGVPAGLGQAVRDTERSLLNRGWVRLTKIQDKDGEVSVLVLNDENAILGLTVLIFNREEGELVFTNVAGTLDLHKLQEFGKKLEVPGLKDIEVDRE